MQSKRDQVAEYFREHAGEWIDGDNFRYIGGKYAYRTRISDCRTQLGMTIENRRRVLEGAHGRYTVSEYKYVPPPDRERERYEDDGQEYGHPDDMRDELRGL